MADNANTIWGYLKLKGLSDVAVAGIMGNLQAESGLRPDNLQNSYEKKLGLNDAQYTAAVDNGSYKNFVRDSAGYGLAQWTYWSRKQNLLNYAKAQKASIGNLNMQLGFLWQELSANSAIMTGIKKAKTVRAASDVILLKFERPADQSESVQKKRASYGQSFYDAYAGSKTGQPVQQAQQITGSATVTVGFIADTIGGIKVNSSIPCSPANYENRASRQVKYIVMHYTGNIKDAAVNNAKYFAGGGRNASAHLFVDDKEIYQSVELRDKAWHCGAKTYKHAECRNENSIGIEMCCTAGNYKVSEQTKVNAAYLCAYLCRLVGITAAGVDKYVVRHYDVTGKKCPAQMAGEDNAEWADFLNMVKKALGATVSAPAFNKKVTCTGNGVRIRKGGGTGYAILTAVNKGTVMYWDSTKQNGWYHVKHGNTVGYMHPDYVKE